MADLTLNFRGEQVDVVKNIDLILRKLTAMDKKLGTTSNEGVKSTKKLSNAFTKMSGRITRVMTGMVGKISALLGAGGLVAVFVKATKAAKTFETGLAEVGTLLGEAADKLLPQYRKSILELARTSSATANELTKGLYQVISAGTKGTEEAAGSMKLLTIANKAAVAGVASTFESVDLLTTSLNAYNKSTDSAVEFSDALFTSVRLGKTTFSELASQLGNVASIAAGAGVSFDEVNASVAAMTKGGLSTDIAVTALNATIVSMLSPSKELTKLMNKMGFESAAAALKQKGLLEVMKMVGEVTEGDTEKMQKLFTNVRALRGVAVLAGTGMQNFSDAVAAMGNKAGATEAAYKKMSATFEFKTKRFGNLINEVLIRIGDKMLPILIEKFEAVGEWLEANGDKVVGFFDDLFTAIEKLFLFLTDHGGKVATVFATLWAAGPILTFISLIGKAKVAVIGLIATAAPLVAIAAAAAYIATQLPDELVVTGSNVRSKESRDREKTETEKQLINIRDGAFVKNKFEELLVLFDESIKKYPVIANAIIGAESKGGTKQNAAALEAAKAAAEAAAIAEANARERANKKASDKFLAERKVALSLLHSLRLSQLDKEDKIRQKMFDDLLKLSKVKRLSDNQREEAENIIRANAAKKLNALKTKLDEKRMKRLRELAERQESLALEYFNKFMQPILDENEARREKILGREMPEGILEGIETGFIEEIASQFGVKSGDGFLDRVKEAMGQKIGKTLFNIMGQAGGLLVSPFRKIIDLIMQFVQAGDVAGAEGILNDFLTFMENMSNNLDEILEWIIQTALPRIIDSMVENIPTIIDAVVDNIPTLVQDLIRSIPKIVNAIIKKIPKIISGIVELIPIIINEIIAAIPQIVGAFIAQMPYIALELVKAIFSAVYEMTGAGLLKGKGKKGGSTLPVVEGSEEAIKAQHLKDRKKLLDRARVENAVVTPTFHEGGMIDGMINLGKTIRAHSGMFVGGLRGDEVPIIAQMGEAVLNRQATADMGGEAGINALNNGGGAGAVHYHMNWQPEYAFVEDSAQVIDQMQAELIRKKGGQMQNVIGSNNGFKARRG